MGESPSIAASRRHFAGQAMSGGANQQGNIQQGLTQVGQQVNPSMGSVQMPRMGGQIGTAPQQNPMPGIQNPPTGGVAGAPGYSQGQYPQPIGGYWNQLTQRLAGPQYQATQQQQRPQSPTTGYPGLFGSGGGGGGLPY